jgi:hypothetical protein
VNSLRGWFEEDVSTRLDSVENVASHYPEGPFKAGFHAAIQSVRMSFGLPHTTLVIPNMTMKHPHRLLEIVNEP